jgi:ribosomal-protein-alanine N-acetyltransferase
MNNPFIIGEKIYLRPLDLNDLNGNYINWLNDPIVTLQNSHHLFPNSKIDLENYIRNAYVSNDKLPLAIVDINNDKHIGNISLVDINYINRRANWGLVIGEKEYWGKGVAKEASILILKHAFETLNIKRIFSGTTEKNIGGQKLMEAVGMIREGISRKHIYKNGEYLDIVNYGVLKEEFYSAINK